MDNFLIPLFSIVIMVVFYPFLLLYVGSISLIAGVGVFTWLILAAMFSPYVVVWYIILRKRALDSLRFMLVNKTFVWDIDKTLAEYKKMLQP